MNYTGRSNPIGGAHPITLTFSLYFIIILSMDRIFDVFRRPNPEILKREKETIIALNEAKSIIEKHDLPKRVHQGMDIDALKVLSDSEQNIVDNTRVILRVPRATFPELVDEMKVEYVYQWSYPNDNTGGYGDKLVWFVTDNKLRVLMETSPIDGGFMENIVFPSSQAQTARVANIIGGRTTSFEEIAGVNREEGFSVYDPLVGLGGTQVSKVKLLTPDEAGNFKGALIAFKMGPNSDNSSS